MTDDAEPNAAPYIDEFVGLCPAVEGDHETVRLQDPVAFRKGRFEPMGLVVILNGASLAVLIANQIGRIGKDEVNRVFGQRVHGLDGVAVNDAVGWKGFRVELVRLHGFLLLMGSSDASGTPGGA